MRANEEMLKMDKRYLKVILLIINWFPALLFSACVPVVYDELVQCLNDKVPPVITIDCPSDGADCANIVEVSGRVTDLAADTGTPGVVKRLYYQIPANLSTGVIEIKSGGAYSINITTDKLDGNFILQLTAVDWHDNTTVKTISLFRIPNNGIPSFKAIPGNKELILKWDNVPHTVSYTLNYSRNGNQPSDNFSKQVHYITSPFTLKPLDNCTIYKLQLKTMPDEDWPASSSDFIKVIPLSEQSLAPQVVSGFKKIDISWSPIYSNFNDSAYQVWKSTRRDDGYVNISGDIISPQFTDTEVEAGQYYYYKIIPYQGNNTFSIANGMEPSPFPDKPYVLKKIPVMRHVYNLAIAGSYAYVNGTGGVEVLDIKDPVNPLPIKYISIPDSSRTKLIISGSFAFLPNGSAGLEILDIYNPYDAKRVKTIPSKSACDVAIRNSYAYIADANSGLQIVDISDPYQAHLVKTESPIPSADRIAISDSYAYLAKRGTGVYVLDISNPQKALLVTTIPISNFDPWRMMISGSYLYIADSNVSLYTIDISNPNNPVVMSPPLTTASGGTIDMALSGSFIYLTDNRNTLQIVDITNPGAPRLNQIINSAGSHRGIAISGYYAYVTCSDSIQIIDINNPYSASLNKTVPIPGSPNRIAVSGNYVYITNHTDLQILDINNPDAPPLKTLPIPALDARDLAISGPYAFVVDAENGLEIFDVSDPGNTPLEPWWTPVNGAVQGVTAAGAYAYVVDTDGLKIIDINDPRNAFKVSELALDYLLKVNVCGNYAYLAAGTHGLFIVDISNPDSPLSVGTENSFKNDIACDIAVSGKYAYLAVKKVGVLVIDVSNPQSPTLVKTVDATASAYSLTISGFYLYVASLDAGLQIISISDPLQATVVKTVKVTGLAVDVAVSGAHAYVADGNAHALQIINLK